MTSLLSSGEAISTLKARMKEKREAKDSCIMRSQGCACKRGKGVYICI